MAFKPKSFPEIVASMAAKVAAETPITDFNPGSVILTLLEAPAQEDFQQYVAMLEIILNYNLDTTTGSDLDARALEYGLTRQPARAHSGYVSIIDTRFDKVSTKLYSGLPGPTADTNVLYVDDASSFPASGSLYVGRGSQNAESVITYSSAPVNSGSYWTLTLDTNLTKDHGTDETVILSQFGDRTVTAGTEVRIPPNDFSEAIVFELNQPVVLLDGENRIDNVLVTALVAGGFVVPSDSIIEFINSPFSGGVVTNPLPFVNGRDQESDQELRDRIRDTVQALARGTPRSVKTNIIGIVDPVSNSSIISANVVPPVVLADGPTKVYINNGRGLEPELDSTGYEVLIEKATGGESFFQAQLFPLVKANLISQLSEPFNLTGGETLILNVGNVEEVFTFAEDDFRTAGKAQAVEVAEAINARSNLFEARTMTIAGARKIIITPVARTNEDIQLDATSTAQAAFNFNTKRVYTAKLYKNDQLLSKDGITAAVATEAQPYNLSTDLNTTSDGDFAVTSGSRIVTKSSVGTGLNSVLEQVHPGDYVKFSNDNDDYYIQVQTVVDAQKFILAKAYPLNGGGIGNLSVWNSPQLEIASNGDVIDTELVSFGPNDFVTPTQALASEVLKRLKADVQQSGTELAVNSTKVRIISEIENSADSKMQIVGGGAAVELGFCTVSPLSGTLVFTGGGKMVIGTNTKFTSELVEGQWVKSNSAGKGSWTRIETIESDTVMYLKDGYRGPNASGASSRINLGTASLGQDRDYTMNFSNGQIELASPLVAGDSLTLGSINTRAFVDSLGETYDFAAIGSSSRMIVRVDGGFKGSVSTGDNIPPYNQFLCADLVDYEPNFFAGFHLEWTSGNNIGQVDQIASYDASSGQLVLVGGTTLQINADDKFVLSQMVTFNHASDFADPQSATALEVVNALNSRVYGASALKKASNSSVRLQTANFSGEGQIQVLGGSANQVLNFPTSAQANQEPNLAFATSSNSDRDGLTNFRGFTLGPDQNLVVIIDGDNVNRTFVIPSSVNGTVDVGFSGSFISAEIAALYPSQDTFVDFWVYWKTGALAGKVQTVTSYNGITGEFQVEDVYPAVVGQASSSDTFALVPRTAENVKRHFQNLNLSTISTATIVEVTGISGDNVQLTTTTPGSKGKVFVSGGTANSLQIPIVGVVPGSPSNDVSVNSIAGLAKGLPIKLRVSGTVTSADGNIPYNTFTSAALITTLPSYFEGLKLTFTSGLNAGKTSTVLSYNNTTGEISISDMLSPINASDAFVIDREATISDIQNSTAPYNVSVTEADGTLIDVSGYTSERNAQIKDLNGLNFERTQFEGTDGYKFYTGLIQLAQWTIDGLDRDESNYSGFGAAGTQFEVIPPVIKSLSLTLNVTADNGVNLSAILNEITSAVLGYVNSRKVGEDVILSEIVAAAQSVNGVFDVKITSHTDNIVIADGEQAYLDNSDLIVG